MRQKILYLYLEIRKTLGMVPRMFLQAILLMILIGAIAFCGVKSMEKKPLAVNVDIGIVVQEENAMTKMALAYIENMESVSQICSFRQVSEEEGTDLLTEGKLVALIVLPGQLVEGIMNGNNPEVKIVFPENARLEAMLLRELTESGAGLLRVAQAQIYGAYDTAVEYGLTDRLSQMEMEIDSYNLAFALDRLALYETEMISATGRMSALQLYMSSGVVLFLLLSGMAVYPVVQQEPLAFRRQLKRQGTGKWWQCFCQWMCGFVCMVLCVVLSGGVVLLLKNAAATVIKNESGEKGLSTFVLSDGNSFLVTAPETGLAEKIGISLLVIATAATLIYFLYSIAQSKTGGILLIFLCSTVAVYLSGGLIPSPFLPQAMQAVGDRLPTAYMMRAVGGLLAGYEKGAMIRCVAGLCGYTVLSALGACLLRGKE